MRTKAATTIGALLAALAIAGCGGGGDDKISASAHKDYIKGCTEAGQPEAGCECIYDELKKRGIDTEDKFKKLADDIQEAAKAADPASALPKDFKDAATECKDELQQQ